MLRGRTYSTLIPNEGDSLGAWGHYGVIEGRMESHTTPLFYFFMPFLPPHLPK